MSDYTKATDFAAKDALLTGNPAKLVKGTEIDTEFNNIATAVATKYDSADLGVTLQQYDADLAAIAALAKTDGNVIVGDGSTWVAESGATARTSLGAAATGANTFTGLQQLDYSSAIASAATVDLGTATGNSVTVTHASGTTAITSFGGAATVQKGGIVAVIPSISSGTLTVTHHATNMILLGGADITLASGDVLLMMKNHDSNAEWKHICGWKADGTAWVTSGNVKLAGDTVQVVEATPYTTYSSTSTIIPNDDTIPQNTEGAEFLTVTITPTSASNRLRIEVDAPVMAPSGAIYIIGAIFQDSTANALAVSSITPGVTNYLQSMRISHEMAAGTTSATTFKLRIGPSGGTVYINGISTGRLFGGAGAIRMRVTEIKV